MKQFLQVYKDNRWQYVFCHNEVEGIITTDKERNALTGNDLEYFSRRYANHKFRLFPNYDVTIKLEVGNDLPDYTVTITLPAENSHGRTVKSAIKKIWGKLPREFVAFPFTSDLDNRVFYLYKDKESPWSNGQSYARAEITSVLLMKEGK